jgi:SAM-dependent methyltransferase
MGAARAAQLALDKQAPISHFLPHNPFLRVDRYDCVYGHEAFYRILDKLNLFNEIWKSMKEGGHLIFTDLVYAGRDVKITDEIRNWVNAEPEAPDPWTPEEYREKFEKLGFEFVSFEDDTPRYQQLIKDGWANFTDTLDEQGIDRRFVDIMMHEANIWQCRMQAIKSGNLRFLRIHAQRPKATLR